MGSTSRLNAIRKAILEMLDEVTWREVRNKGVARKCGVEVLVRKRIKRKAAKWLGREEKRAGKESRKCVGTSRREGGGEAASRAERRRRGVCVSAGGLLLLLLLLTED